MAKREQPPIDPQVALDVRDLGIKYDLAFTRKNTARETFERILRRKRQDRTFWALKDVTFQVRRGESVGVIGANGAGKSTLLLVLAGIIQPSRGVVTSNGHISTLLSLQAGFDQDLTGRDNIALAGALLGVDHREMERRTPEIIEFAEVGAFIDAPMKTYSSGMRARLGFSIATSVDPDILLLDEVLQTGDASFKEKSRRRIIDVLQSAKAVVLVTHDMTWVNGFCSRAILLENGRIVADGDPAEVTAQHIEASERRKAERRARTKKMKAGEVEVDSLRDHRARKRTGD